MKKKKEKVKVNLLFEEGLKDFLEKYNLLQQFEDKKIFCKNCGKIITTDNLGFVEVMKNEVFFICDDVNCAERRK